MDKYYLQWYTVNLVPVLRFMVMQKPSTLYIGTEKKIFESVILKKNICIYMNLCFPTCNYALIIIKIHKLRNENDIPKS